MPRGTGTAAGTAGPTRSRPLRPGQRRRRDRRLRAGRQRRARGAARAAAPRHRGPSRSGRAAPLGARAAAQGPHRRPDGRHAAGGPGAARQGGRRPSGGSCSPTRTTPPGWPRPSSTRCPRTPRRPSARSRTTRGARDEARQAYEQIQDLLRREVLDSSVRLDEAGAGERRRAGHAGGQGHGRRPLAAHRRAQPRRGHRRAVRRLHGQARPVLPGRPAVGRGAHRLPRPPGRRAGTDDGRALAGAAGRAGRPDGPDAWRTWGWPARWPTCSDALRQARPDLPVGPARAGARRRAGRWAWATPPAPSPSSPTSRRCPASSPRATPGASLADIDEELLERALGRPAVDDLAALRQLERELERQGYLNRSDGKLELSPKAVRRLGATALRRVFAKLDAAGRGDHDVADAGAAGELTGSSREWRFGDEQPLDVVRTVKNAVLRTAHEPRGEHDRRVRIAVEDFEVVETERRTGGGRRAAGRPLLLDGAARHLGRGEVDGDGAALAGHHPASRRTRSRSSGSPPPPRCCARDPRRAVGGHPAGHQPAARR